MRTVKKYGQHRHGDAQSGAARRALPLLLAATAILSWPAPAKAHPGQNDQRGKPYNLYVGDIDGDGMDDFVQVSRNRIFVSHADADKTGLLHYYLPGDTYAGLTTNFEGLIVGNFSGGGNKQTCGVLPDLNLLTCYASSSDHKTLWWWFQQPNFISSTQSVIVADLDGNGTDDLLVYDRPTGRLSAYTFNGSGFGPIPRFSLGNLTSVAQPNWQFRAVSVKGGRGGIMAISPDQAIYWFYSLFDGTNNTFWYAFNTGNGFANGDVSTARIDDDDVDDVVIVRNGAFSFYHIVQFGAGLQPITNVSIGGLAFAAGHTTYLYWGRFMPNLPEPGGSTRDSALLVDTTTGMMTRWDARWNGSQYTYWWTYTIPVPVNYNWPAPSYDKWAVLLCTYADHPQYVNPYSNQSWPTSYFQNLFTNSGRTMGGLVDYFLDESYGTVDVGLSEVHGPYFTNAPFSSQVCDRNCMIQRCVGRATDVNAVNYRSVVAIDSAQNDTGSPGANMGVHADPFGLFPAVMGHEMLHVYGLSHSYDAAGLVPYRDPFDVMSNNSNTFEYFNPAFPGTGDIGCFPQFANGICGGSGPSLVAAYKDAKGWIASERRWATSLGTGRADTIALAAVGAPEANGYLWARIAGTVPGTFFTVELRTRDGWDQQMGSNSFDGGRSRTAGFDHAILLRYYDNVPEPGEIFGKARNRGALTEAGTSIADVGGLVVTLNSYNAAAHTASVTIVH
jgi:hypothetical protein